MLNTTHLYIFFLFFFFQNVCMTLNYVSGPSKNPLWDSESISSGCRFSLAGVSWEVTAVFEEQVAKSFVDAHRLAKTFPTVPREAAFLLRPLYPRWSSDKYCITSSDGTIGTLNHRCWCQRWFNVLMVPSELCHQLEHLHVNHRRIYTWNKRCSDSTSLYSTSTHLAVLTHFDTHDRILLIHTLTKVSFTSQHWCWYICIPT